MKLEKYDLIELIADDKEKGSQAIIENVSEYSDELSVTWAPIVEFFLHASWWNPKHFKLIEKNREDLLHEWKDEMEREQTMQMDLEWIFENYEHVGSKWPTYSVFGLAKHMGIEEMWGYCGEGMVFFANIDNIKLLSRPYLKNKDKEGFLKKCEEYKKKYGDNLGADVIKRYNLPPGFRGVSFTP